MLSVQKGAHFALASMSSLAEIPELVGFFSYSREDDEDSHGALSALRNRIQGELRGQLGRTAKTFRLWQDKEAIPSGTLWETEIKNAVRQAVFFIPIITPTVVASPYCRFELEAFLTREAELGRDDLVFPILYIDVPALEDSVRRQNDPVLSLIAKRQYVDWRKLRHRDVRTTDASEAVERFCTHIRNALQRPWISAEERKRQEEVAAQDRVEAERLRREIDAKRLAEEEKARVAAEAQVRKRTEEEQHKRDAEAEQRRREAAVAKLSEDQKEAAETRAFGLGSKITGIVEPPPDPSPASKPTYDRIPKSKGWQPPRRALVVGGLVVASALGIAALVISSQRTPLAPAVPGPHATAQPESSQVCGDFTKVLQKPDLEKALSTFQQLLELGDNPTRDELNQANSAVQDLVNNQAPVVTAALRPCQHDIDAAYAKILLLLKSKGGDPKNLTATEQLELQQLTRLHQLSHFDSEARLQQARIETLSQNPHAALEILSGIQAADRDYTNNDPRFSKMFNAIKARAHDLAESRDCYYSNWACLKDKLADVLDWVSFGVI